MSGRHDEAAGARLWENRLEIEIEIEIEIENENENEKRMSIPGVGRQARTTPKGTKGTTKNRGCCL